MKAYDTSLQLLTLNEQALTLLALLKSSIEDDGISSKTALIVLEMAIDKLDQMDGLVISESAA
jgi:hypothetical protein